MALIAVKDLHVYLGESHVLQGVSFEVPEGGVTALLGRNGVGKTTTLRAMMGLVPRRGSVTLAPKGKQSEELNRLPTHQIVRGPRRLRRPDSRREPPPRRAERQLTL